jgi:hypothetical protein
MAPAAADAAPWRDLNTAFSADGGASWQLRPGSIIPRGATYVKRIRPGLTLKASAPGYAPARLRVR